LAKTEKINVEQALFNSKKSYLIQKRDLTFKKRFKSLFFRFKPSKRGLNLQKKV
jgi:hypothetical protein